MLGLWMGAKTDDLREQIAATLAMVAVQSLAAPVAPALPGQRTVAPSTLPERRKRLLAVYAGTGNPDTRMALALVACRAHGLGFVGDRPEVARALLLDLSAREPDPRLRRRLDRLAARLAAGTTSEHAELCGILFEKE
ncbi:MAG: hypothetical protein HYZ53_01565 [Planctomycetes bacterium]|nr:hypothetical protein [Planctomycetota bacterium]